MACYYILVVTFVISIFVSNSEMSRVKQLVILIALVLYPFIIDAIVKWVLSGYTTLQEDASRNVYLDL
jgi:branched-subunit amino acid permease